MGVFYQASPAGFGEEDHMMQGLETASWLAGSHQRAEMESLKARSSCKGSNPNAQFLMFIEKNWASRLKQVDPFTWSPNVFLFSLQYGASTRYVHVILRKKEEKLIKINNL